MGKRVYIAYTGGTIGMRRDGEVYRPQKGYLEQTLGTMPEIGSDALPEFQVSEYDPLLDSCDVSPHHWERIAQDIKSHEDFDGFIVLHGTDTMAYTASALSFMLEGLHKPVIVTGSQIPLCEVRSDARDNLIDALMIAGHEDMAVPEVALLFDGQLLRGNRSVKTSTDALDAFTSPNYRQLGTGGVHVTLYNRRIRSADPGPLRIANLGEAHVASLRLFPGIKSELLEAVLREPLQGVVIEAFGVGNAPTDPGILAAIKHACDRGVVVVVSTQCLHGGVDLKTYAAGALLADAGALSGYDMTVEAAMTKMYWLLAQGLKPDVVRARMQEDLRGEVTTPDDPRRAILR